MLKNKILLLLFILSNFCFAELFVGNIKFEGNNLISNNELLNNIQTQTGNVFNQQGLNNDASLISELYFQKGYYNIKVQSPQIFTKSPTQIDILFKIEELKKLNIKKIILTGNHYLSNKKIFESISQRNLNLNELSFTVQNIVDFYTSNGFLFADVKIDSLVKIKDFLDVYLSIDEGKFCEFDEFKFKGNKTTKDRTLLKISQLNSIETITPQILDQSAENIRKKRYIENCEIIPLNHSQLLISVEEGKMSLISGIVGYDNSQPKKNKLSGYLNIDFLNLYGTDRALSLLWQRVSSDRSSIELKYHESGFYRYPVCGDFLVFREEVDSTYIKTTFGSDIYYYDLINKYGIYFGMDDIFPGSRRPKIVEKTSFKKAGVFWERNNLDYQLNPYSGSKYFLKYYYIFNRIESKNISKQAVELSYDKYQKISKNMVFAISLNANIIENKNLTEFEIYELGGSQNLRGFNENQFSGFRVGWSNIEMRYLLSRNSRAFIFTDYGYVESNVYTLGKLFGFGFGLRVETRLGILGIDYGLGYSDGELRNPLDGIIHFGIESKL